MTIRKRISTVICLLIVTIMCLIGIISNFSYKSFIANASTIESFVGTSGSPSGASLYNATNTYNVTKGQHIPSYEFVFRDGELFIQQIEGTYTISYNDFEVV